MIIDQKSPLFTLYHSFVFIGLKRKIVLMTVVAKSNRVNELRKDYGLRRCPGSLEQWRVRDESSVQRWLTLVGHNWVFRISVPSEPIKWVLTRRSCDGARAPDRPIPRQADTHGFV